MDVAPTQIQANFCRMFAAVRRETGKEYEVKVLYGEGSRTAPAPSRAQSIARSAAKRR